MSRSCRTCLLSDAVDGVTVDDARLCDYCAGRQKEPWIERFGVTEEKKAERRAEMEKMFEQARGKADYDCVLALSGGKDSSYLLYNLAVERGLKVLAVHIDLPFESPVAKENIERLKSKLSFDLEIVKPDKEFYYRFFKHLFQHPVKEGYIKTICYICGPLNVGQSLKFATDRKIPLVVLGVSPFQPDNMFFEWDREAIAARDWIPELFKTEEFDDAFRSNFWNPFGYPEGTEFPRVIAPLHVIDYKTDEIMADLAAKGLIPRKKSNPAVTNCALNWPMILLDTKLLGHNPYLKEFATLVRRGESPRAFWKNLLRIVNLQIKLGMFKKREIREVESVLGLSFAECATDAERIDRKFQEYP